MFTHLSFVCRKLNKNKYIMFSTHACSYNNNITFMFILVAG